MCVYIIIVAMDADVRVPPAKRPRLEEPQNSPPQRSIIDCVLRPSNELLSSLNVNEILNAMISPVLSFLELHEKEKLEQLLENETPSRRITRRLLNFIIGRQGEARDGACRRFVACIVQTMEEERGHKDLKKIYRSKLPEHEWRFIEDLLREVNDSPMPSPYRTPLPRTLNARDIRARETPERPIPFIELQGQLAEKDGFATIERDLWLCFSNGEYSKLEHTVLGVQRDRSFRTDCQIVAMWFNSLIIMHRDGGYLDAIRELSEALLLCKRDNCVNRTILEGRIYQRMTQNYLMNGLQDLAMKTFELAKDRLQMVGRGYDKANMFCREAKIMSALEPHRRAEIEDTYNRALRALEKDDPYFLASFPSVTLSKAGFYLGVSFGSKVNDGSTLPDVRPSDIAKAEETLKTIVEGEHILLEMRRFEYSFLCAELCRLQGEVEKAREQFAALTTKPGSSKVKNIVSLAEQRLQNLTPQL